MAQVQERIPGQRMPNPGDLDINQAALKLRGAQKSHDDELAKLKEFERQYSEALTFGESPNVDKLDKTISAQKDRVRRLADLLHAAKIGNEAAMKHQAERDEAERCASIKAANARMEKAMEEAEAPIAALAELVRTALEAQAEMRNLSKGEEIRALRWRVENVNAALIPVFVERLFAAGMVGNNMPVGLPWEDKAVGRVKWADFLKPRVPRPAASENGN